MERIPRNSYTYEFNMEAVRLVESSRLVVEAARSVGVLEQTLSNWIKAHKSGTLVAHGRGSKLTAKQIEIRQLRAENTRLKIERDIFHPAVEDLSAGTPAWEKQRRTSRRARDEVRPYLSPSLAGSLAVRRS